MGVSPNNGAPLCSILGREGQAGLRRRKGRSHYRLDSRRRYSSRQSSSLRLSRCTV